MGQGFFEAVDIVVDFRHEVEAIMRVIPSDGHAFNIVVGGVHCSGVTVDFGVVGVIEEIMIGDDFPIAKVAVHLRDVVVGELKDFIGLVFGEVREEGSGEGEH